MYIHTGFGHGFLFARSISTSRKGTFDSSVRTRKGYFIIVRETRARRWFRGNTRFKIMPDVSTTFTWNYIAERVPFDELVRVYVCSSCVALAKSTEQIRGTRKCRSL